MKKSLFVLTLIILVAGCAAPTSTSAPATETLQPLATNTPVPTAISYPTLPPMPTGLPDNVIPNGFGVTTHYMFFPQTYFEPNEGDLLQQSGIRIVKDVISKSKFACTGRSCDFIFADRLVLRMRQAGIRVLFDLNNVDQAPHTAEERNEFKSFAALAAKHFAGKGVIWELWGEPDGVWAWAPKSDPAEYALMADETITAMREADPNAIIIGPNVATLDTIYDDNPWRFLKALGDAGVLTRFDAINVHLYNGSTPESQIPNLLRLRQLVDKYSPEKRLPIVSTEWGYTTRGEFYKFQATLDEQTKFVARSFLIHAAHEINLSLYYDWKDDEITPDLPDYEGTFGITNVLAEPKPGYFALKALTSTLNDHLFVRRLSTASNDDYLLLFRKGDKGILAAWTTSDPHLLTIPDVASDIESIQMLGEIQTLKPDAQGLSVHLTDSPQYLSLPNGFLGDEEIYWRPDGTFFRLNQSGHAEIPILIENRSDQLQSYHLQAILNDQITGSNDGDVDANQTRTFTLPLDIAADPAQQDFLIKITVTNQEKSQTAWVWVQR